MLYVESLRVRKGLAIYLAVVVVGLLLFVATAHVGGSFRGQVTSGDSGHSFSLGSTSSPASNDRPAVVALPDLLRSVTIPVGVLFAIASIFAGFFAFSRATSLNAQRDSLDIAFTLPVARGRLALSVIALDSAAIVVAFVAFLAIVCYAPLAYFGLLGRIVSNGGAIAFASLVALAIGTPLMLYAVFQALTAWYARRPGAIVAAAVVVFFLADVLGGVSLGVLSYLFAAIREIDPLHYVVVMFEGSLVSVLTNGSLASIPGADYYLGISAIEVWIVAIVGIAIATIGWSRVER